MVVCVCDVRLFVAKNDDVVYARRENKDKLPFKSRLPHTHSTDRDTHTFARRAERLRVELSLLHSIKYPLGNISFIAFWMKWPIYRHAIAGCESRPLYSMVDETKRNNSVEQQRSH